MLKQCVGRSAEKGFCASVQKTTECRPDKKLGRLLGDLSGKKPVKGPGAKVYAMIFRDDMSRMTWEYFLGSKSDVHIGLEQWLADVGVPEIIRSDDAHELKGGEFAEICRKRCIKREFTTADRPQLNGVAERGLALIEKLAKASAIQAKVSFVNEGIPSTDFLWAEAHNYACDVLNRTATVANPGYKSPYEVWYGKPPPPTLLEWLQPCFYRAKRDKKTDAQAKSGFYLGPARNSPRDTVRIYSKETRQIFTGRNVTWRHVSAPTPSSAVRGFSRTPPSPAPTRGEEIDDEVVEEGGEGTSRSEGGGEESSSDTKRGDESSSDIQGGDESSSEEEGDELGVSRDLFPRGSTASSAAPTVGYTPAMVEPFDGSRGGRSTHDSTSGTGFGSGTGDHHGIRPRSGDDRSSNHPPVGRGGGSRGVGSRGDDTSRSTSRTSASMGGGGSRSPASSGGGSKSSSNSSSSGGSDGGKSSGGGDTESTASARGVGESPQLPPMEARRLGIDMVGNWEMRPSRTRGGERKGDDLVEDSSDALISEETEYYDELFESFAGTESLRWGESEDVLDDFHSNLFSFLSSVVDDEVVVEDFSFAAKESERGEVRMPSGPVSEAEVPPVSVAGVHKSEYRDAWYVAMDSELQGLKDSGTFTVLDSLPVGEKAVGSRWVFAYKKDSEGNIVKTKARLVAQGFMQREGVDFFETSAPTPAAASVRVVLAVANELELPVYHMDTAQAFTQAELDCTVYMRLPQGCGSLSGKIVRLEKALYGLKQSGLLWNGLLVEKLVMKHGMEQCKTDPCVFRKMRDNKLVMILAVHVDDIAVAGVSDEIEELEKVLNEDFTTTNLGLLNLFTGCVVEQDVKHGFVSISQTPFIETLAKRFSVTKVSEHPAVVGANLEARMEGESGGPWPYREAVGSLMWLVTMTRPDIANAVRAVARHSHNPTERHWKAVLKIIEYLLGSKELGITFQRGLGLSLDLFTDSNYAEKADDRRSVSGIAICFCGAVVSWASNTQRVIAVSTTEAEYISAGEGVKDALFVKAILCFLMPDLSEKCFDVNVDNAGAISLANNPLSSVRTMHMDVNFLRALVRSNTIEVVYVPTKYQHADILTKPLTGNSFLLHRGLLMNFPGTFSWD